MESFREDIQYEHPFLSIKVFDTTREPHISPKPVWHYHKEVELLALISGRFGFYLNEDLYMLEPGDVLMIGSNELHRDYACDYARLVVFQFDMEEHLGDSGLPYYRSFTDSSLPLSRFNYILQEQPDTRAEVLQCIKEILQESSAKKDGYEIAISILIKKIILSLLRGDTRRLIPRKETTELLRLKPVLDFIEENIGDKLQVEDASKRVNMSYHYFVKFFKKALGVSFVDYVTIKKIKRAERLLLTKDMSITQIGEEVGMNNMAHFYKMFRKYKGCSPNEYRKRMMVGDNKEQYVL